MIQARPRKPKHIWVTAQNLDKIAGMPRDTVFRAWKASTRQGLSPNYPSTRPRLVCERGKTLTVKHADMNVRKSCAAGVNVATLRWVVRTHEYDATYWVVEFTGRDIAAVPDNSTGKFRLFTCRVIRRHGRKYVERLIEGNYAEAGEPTSWS